MEVAVAVTELTDTEPYLLEYLLRKIKDNEKSPSTLRLGMAVREKIRWRARYTLVDFTKIGGHEQ